MTKCDVCDKNITKRNPGMECRKCEKIVHATQVCSALTAKQLAVLRNTENLEWTCEECKLLSPRRKSSLIIPEDDEEEEEQGDRKYSPIDVKKLLKDISISSQVDKIVGKQLEPIEESLNFYGKKIDDFSTFVEGINQKLKDLENKNTYLVNQNKNLETRVSYLEQHIGSIEQANLGNKVEIAGVPYVKDEDLPTISNKIAVELKTDPTKIRSTRRISHKNVPEGPLLVELTDAEAASTIVRASKRNNLTAERVIPNILEESKKSNIFVRMALTKCNKTLLWNANQKLRPSYKYVWFQDGKVLARKDDNVKPIIIRSTSDISKILGS